MPSKLALDIQAALAASADRIIETLDPPDKRVPWPGQNRSIWPQADISGRLTTGEIFIVEIDDHADPGRSLAKYWPLLHAVSKGEYEFPPILYFAISSPDGTFGRGYDLLARFVGDRFQEIYPTVFKYRYTSLHGKDANRLAKEILAFLRAGTAV